MNILRCFKKRKDSEKGVILLLTIIILSSLMAVALALASVFIMQFRLATGARDSTQAIYAADSGIEWRMFAERKGGNPSEPVFLDGVDHIDWEMPGTTLKVTGSYHGTSRALEVRDFK